ncbi:unnamed protein product, partial [Mesorhabditis belari]|uniref:Sulfotransferase n=1 Tax=Mesorhabditis belari TaxID=2138241 RepID=A0AAF3F9Y5_9BILA
MKTSQFFVIFFVLYILESRITSSAGIDALENYQLGLQFCPIPKTGSTITHTMLCDIHREYRGIFFERKYSSDLGGDNDCKLNDWYPEHHKAFWAKRKVPLKFTIVRDPIDRFVSLYGSACDQLKMCKDRDIHEFAHWVNNMRKQRGAAARKIRDGEGHELYRWIFYHALPQTSFCNLVADRERSCLVGLGFRKGFQRGLFFI